MATQVSVTLDDDQQQRLEALAAQRAESVADVARQAIAEYLAEDAVFRRAVADGLAAADAGDVVDWRPYADDLRRRMAIRTAQHEWNGRPSR